MAPLEHHLTRSAAWVRREVLEMIARSGAGHIGGSLSCTDILVTLYQGGVLHTNPAIPDWPGRDRFIQSKGHAVEALWATLALSGFIPPETLLTYGSDGTCLGGHPDRGVPGVEASTGSLGHGLGIGSGLALATRHQQQDALTFVLLGDGECYEGSVWEAAQFAAHHQLGNLIAIVDRNRQITLDDTEVCNRFEPFADKWRAFGWETRDVDGHSFPALLGALSSLRTPARSQPLAIIAHTLKGKGISFMETSVGWHHRVPKGDQLAQARRELDLTLNSVKPEPQTSRVPAAHADASP